MARYSFLSAILLALRAAAQSSTSYTDPSTGIDFVGYKASNYTFGLALPENPTTDFIGQLSSQYAQGWAGVTLGASMANHLIIAAWPNGNDVLASFRKATGYSAPPVYSGAWSLMPIAAGTFANSSGYQYTFLCQKCITGDALTFVANASAATFGWGLSSSAVASPSDPSTALNFHTTGFGLYGENLTAARSANYDTWAAMADTGSTPSTTSSTTSSPTSSSTPSEIPSPISTPIPSASKQKRMIEEVRYSGRTHPRNLKQARRPFPVEVQGQSAPRADQNEAAMAAAMARAAAKRRAAEEAGKRMKAAARLDPVQARRPLAAGYKIAAGPERYEDEEGMLKRSEWERASFLDVYNAE